MRKHNLREYNKKTSSKGNSHFSDRSKDRQDSKKLGLKKGKRAVLWNSLINSF